MRPCRMLTWAVVGAALAMPALAIEGTVDVGVQSAFIWRGMVLNDKPVLQPSLTVSHGDFAAGAWFNLDLTDDWGHRFEVNEADYWFAYTFETPKVDVTATGYSYTFPRTDVESTREIWVNATFKTLFSPSITVVRDVDAIEGWYFLLTGTQPLGVLVSDDSEGLAVTVNVGHGTREYTRGYFPDHAGDHVTDFGARVDWPIRVGGGTLTFNAQYTAFATSGLEMPDFPGRNSNFVAGAGYSLSF